jgi:hypothetical protein
LGFSPAVFAELEDSVLIFNYQFTNLPNYQIAHLRIAMDEFSFLRA